MGMGWDLCSGLLYEHRFAMLINRLIELTFIPNFNSQISDCSILRISPRVWCIDVDVGKLLRFFVCRGKFCRLIDQDGECVFLSVEDLIHFYPGPLTSRRRVVADVSRKDCCSVQRCRDQKSPRGMQRQSRHPVSSPGTRSWARAPEPPGGEMQDGGVPSPLVAARVHLNGDSPFLAQFGDLPQEVVLGKLFFRRRRENCLPRVCKRHYKSQQFSKSYLTKRNYVI